MLSFDLTCLSTLFIIINIITEAKERKVRSGLYHENLEKKKERRRKRAKKKKTFCH